MYALYWYLFRLISTYLLSFSFNYFQKLIVIRDFYFLHYVVEMT